MEQALIRDIDKLQAVMLCARENLHLDADLNAWLSEALGRFFDRQKQSLDDAFNIRTQRGGMPWWREEANRARDAALRQFADLSCPGDCSAAKARCVETASLRYAASAWRHDRLREAMPDYYRGTARECLWMAFKSGAPMPLGQRQLRNILV